MREIKFRAWDTRYKKWLGGEKWLNFSLLGETTLLGGFDSMLWENANGDSIPIVERYNDVIIEQYTGIKDADGVEIYEGDICKWFTTESGQTPIWPIHYNSERCCFMMGPRSLADIFDSGFYQPCDGESSNLRAIGNIHQNPELLNR